MTKVKICGLMDQAIVDGTVAAGADYLGFVFAKSKRQVTPETVYQLTKKVPETVKLVGVFVSPTWAEIEEALQMVSLDALQIHGILHEEVLRKSPVSIIQSFDGQSRKLVQELKTSSTSFILLDAPTTNEIYAGGNGKTFDWHGISAEGRERLREKELFIAGGLTQENVQEAIQIFNPYAVDVSSSVETNGVKDLTKIQAFIQAAKEC
ncbi:phosphoribosylanthranilate isomerase [Enterococcus sp. LJL98]